MATNIDVFRHRGIERRLLWPVLAFAVVVFTVACGGSSGGGGGDVLFTGTVTQDAELDPTARSVPDLQVCALGSCGLTDLEGRYSFLVPSSSYSGGDVQFLFERGEFGASSVVGGLIPNVRDVEADFFVSGEGSVSPIRVAQNGVQIFPDDPLVPGDGDGGEPADPSEIERACMLINSSGISIENAVMLYTSNNDPATCPEPIPSIMTVSNTGAIAFEYIVVADLEDIELFPASGTLMPGESAVHEGLYRCSSLDGFETLLTARIDTILPADSGPVDEVDAARLCGAGADVTNLVTSSPIVVEIAGQ